MSDQEEGPSERATRPEVTLSHTRGAFGLRHLSADRREDGGIEILGHDLGRGVEAWGKGLREYEWTWTVAPESVPAAVEALGGNPGDDPLALLVDWYATNGPTDPGTHLRAAGVPITFWSRIRD